MRRTRFRVLPFAVLAGVLGGPVASVACAAPAASVPLFVGCPPGTVAVGGGAVATAPLAARPTARDLCRPTSGAAPHGFRGAPAAGTVAGESVVRAPAYGDVPLDPSQTLSRDPALQDVPAQAYAYAYGPAADPSPWAPSQYRAPDDPRLAPVPVPGLDPGLAAGAGDPGPGPGGDAGSGAAFPRPYGPSGPSDPSGSIPWRDPGRDHDAGVAGGDTTEHDSAGDPDTRHPDRSCAGSADPACTQSATQHGVEAGAGGTFTASGPALIGGGTLIAAALAGAAHRMWRRREAGT